MCDAASPREQGIFCNNGKAENHSGQHVRNMEKSFFVKATKESGNSAHFNIIYIVHFLFSDSRAEKTRGSRGGKLDHYMIFSAIY
jgi:hypothetical protein